MFVFTKENITNLKYSTKTVHKVHKQYYEMLSTK